MQGSLIATVLDDREQSVLDVLRWTRIGELVDRCIRVLDSLRPSPVCRVLAFEISLYIYIYIYIFFFFSFFAFVAISPIISSSLLCCLG